MATDLSMIELDRGGHRGHHTVVARTSNSTSNITLSTMDNANATYPTSNENDNDQPASIIDNIKPYSEQALEILLNYIQSKSSTRTDNDPTTTAINNNETTPNESSSSIYHQFASTSPSVQSQLQNSRDKVNLEQSLRQLLRTATFDPLFQEKENESEKWIVLTDIKFVILLVHVLLDDEPSSSSNENVNNNGNSNGNSNGNNIGNNIGNENNNVRPSIFNGMDPMDLFTCLHKTISEIIKSQQTTSSLNKKILLE